jgi:hypothetical protein
MVVPKPPTEYLKKYFAYSRAKLPNYLPAENVMIA